MRPVRTSRPEELVTLGLRVRFAHLMIVSMTAGTEACPHVKTAAQSNGSRLDSYFYGYFS